MKKVDPRNIEFHQFVDDVNQGLDIILEEDLLNLEGNREEQLVQLVKILEKNRITIDELLKLIR